MLDIMHASNKKSLVTKKFTLKKALLEKNLIKYSFRNLILSHNLREGKPRLWEKEEIKGMNTQRKESKSMSTHAFSQFRLTSQIVTKLADFNITPTAKLVLLYLSTCYNPKKADMFPKQKTIANKIGISERSVVRAISELFKEGLLIIECKYTNRYKFTSKIAQETPQNDKKISTDNMSDDLGQNDTLKRDKLSRHEHEPIKEQDKQPSSIDDYKILKDYAISRGAKNIKAYVEALKKNGSAEGIIKLAKHKANIAKRAENNIKQTKAQIEKNIMAREEAVSYTQSTAWLELGEKIKKHHTTML